MFSKTLKTITGIVMLLGIMVSGTAFSAAIVVPGADANVEGSANNGFPFSLGYNGRYQQAYAASEFGTGLLWISGMAFRLDGEYGSAFGPTTLTNFNIGLSTSNNAVGSLSSTFDNNIGADAVSVFSGNLTISGTTTVGVNPFDIIVNFQNSFLYDPSQGDLLLNISTDHGLFTTQFDAVNSPLVQRVFDIGGINDVSGLVDSNGLVTQFRVTAVPEPGTLMLLSLGFAGLGFMRRKAA